MVILCPIARITYPASVKHFYAIQKMVGISINLLVKAAIVRSSDVKIYCFHFHISATHNQQEQTL